jgi:hypothetical protein
MAPAEIGQTRSLGNLRTAYPNSSNIRVRLESRATEGLEVFRPPVKPLTLPPLRGGPLPLSMREGFSP